MILEQVVLMKRLGCTLIRRWGAHGVTLPPRTSVLGLTVDMARNGVLVVMVLTSI